MTHDDKISYMKVACGIVGHSFHEMGLDMLVSIYDKIIQMEGNTDLKTLVDVQLEVERKHKAIELEKLKETPKVWK